MRGGVTRVTLWCCLILSCPGTAVATVLRPAFAAVTAVAGFLACVVPAGLLVRDRPPLHRCPPRHARHHTGADTDVRLKVADIQRRLDSEDRLWNLAEFLRRGGGLHKRDFHVIHGGGDDSPGNGNSEASLTSLPAAA